MCYCKIRKCLIIPAFALLGALVSCESEKPPATFYPIDSLLSQQIKLLTSMEAGLVKEALLDGKMDTVRYTPSDTAVWMEELDLFRKLEEINKPVNKSNYRVSDGQLDPASNLKIKEFSSIKEVPVTYLKIFYQGTIDKPRKIEALFDEHNLLYESARFLSMHFQQVDDHTVLTSYSVKGGQKMIFGDSVAFYISGKILID